MIAQLAYQHSNRSLKFQAVFGLFLWSTGLSRKTIDALFCCSLTISYDSIGMLLSHLSQRCICLAKQAVTLPHMFCYDNINISTSNFVKQHDPSTPAKVRSGTFAVLYTLCNAKPSDLKLAPIVNRYKNCKGLSNSDLRLSSSQLKILDHQFSVLVVQVLCTYSDLFTKFANDPALQPTSR
jgi:hypothetical protein